jgi:hypothetical protein
MSLQFFSLETGVTYVVAVHSSRYPLGVEGGCALETGVRVSHENAEKARGLPQVGCTHCWHAFSRKQPAHLYTIKNGSIICWHFALLIEVFHKSNCRIEKKMGNCAWSQRLCTPRYEAQ